MSSIILKAIVALFIATFLTNDGATAAPQLGGGLLLCLSDSALLDDASVGTTLDDLGASLVTCGTGETCTPLDATIDDLPVIGTILGPMTDGNLPLGVSLCHTSSIVYH